MTRFGLCLLVGLSAAVCCGAFRRVQPSAAAEDQSGQKRASQTPTGRRQATAGQKGPGNRPTVDLLVDRIAKLERRVQSLERRLSTRTLRRPTVLEAERELASAKKRLLFTERLVKNGFASELARQQDQFGVNLARKRVELAKAAMAKDADRIHLEVNQMETRHQLETAKARLLYTQKLHARGFAPEIAVTEARLEVERAAERAKQAEAELNRFRQRSGGNK